MKGFSRSNFIEQNPGLSEAGIETQSSHKDIIKYIMNPETDKKYKAIIDDDLSVLSIEDIDELIRNLQHTRQEIIGKKNFSKIETDDELIRRLRDSEGINITQYKNPRDIPLGKEFDKYRQLKKAIMRVKKREQKAKRLSPPCLTNIIQTSTGTILEIIDLVSSPTTLSEHKYIQNVTQNQSNGFSYTVLQNVKTEMVLEIINPTSEPILEIINHTSSGTTGSESNTHEAIITVEEIYDYEEETDPLKVLSYDEYKLCAEFATYYNY